MVSSAAGLLTDTALVVGLAPGLGGSGGEGVRAQPGGLSDLWASTPVLP